MRPGASAGHSVSAGTGILREHTLCASPDSSEPRSAKDCGCMIISSSPESLPYAKGAHILDFHNSGIHRSIIAARLQAKQPQKNVPYRPDRSQLRKASRNPSDPAGTVPEND